MAFMDKAGACAALAGILALGGLAHALSPADKCEAAKNKIAGKYVFCRQNAEAKAIKKGAAPDYTKCDAKYTDKWGKAESAGGCPTTGDQAAQKATLTANANRTACQLSGQPRFNDNGDGTITDRQTCLMWEKKIKQGDGQDFSNLHDADNYYAWAGYCSVDTSKPCQPTAATSAACTAGSQGDPTGCAECTGGDGTCTISYGGGDTAWSWLAALNTASFATHTDWRLPTREELQSIVDYTDTTSPVTDVAFQGAMCGGACGFLDLADCSCTVSNAYLSTSPYATSPGYAWYVDFSVGSSTYVYKHDSYAYYLRAVRSIR